MPRPTGTPEYTKRPAADQVAAWANRVAKKAARFDVAIGPLEVAATYAIFSLAGALVGIRVSLLIPGACDLPVLALGGLIGGLLLAVPARNIRGHRIGIAGASLLAILVLLIVGQCSSGMNTISGEFHFRDACLAKQEAGLPLPDVCKEELAKPLVSAERGLRLTFKGWLAIVSMVCTIGEFGLLFAFLRKGKWYYGAAFLGGIVLLLLLFLLVGRVW